jgi:hypothetical protein
MPLTSVARFFLAQHTQTGKNIQNYHKIYQMATKYLFQTTVKQTKWTNYTQQLTFQDHAKFGFGLKKNIWQPCQTIGDLKETTLSSQHKINANIYICIIKRVRFLKLSKVFVKLAPECKSAHFKLSAKASDGVGKEEEDLQECHKLQVRSKLQLQSIVVTVIIKT